MQVPAQFNFVHSSRRIICAWNGIKQLADLAREAGARRPALVMDAFLEGTATAARAQAWLAEATGIAPLCHVTPPHEPDTHDIEACAAALSASEPDFIVVIGGGSAMDLAKVARMLLSNPGSAEAISGVGKTMKPHASLLVAIPTTAGTGAEVSESAIASKTGADIKLIFRSQEMTPQIALLDAALTVSAPPMVTATSGYDAVTHAVEAYVSNAASVMTDPLAHAAMQLLARWLPVAYREPENQAARTWCLIASAQAAIAFNSANLGLAHAISAPLGAQLHVGHGLGNALALPAVTAYNEPVLGAKGREIARIFGAGSAAAAMSQLRHRLDLDCSLDQHAPDDAARERIAQAAMKSGQVRMNPRQATIEHMRAILQAMRTPTGGAEPVLKL